jgi:hypothetical protein
MVAPRNGEPLKKKYTAKKRAATRLHPQNDKS